MVKEDLMAKASTLNYLSGKVEGIAWGIKDDKLIGALLDVATELISTADELADMANEIEEENK